jgi:hypothetical protein
VTIIVTSALGVLGFGAVLAVALGRAAALADERTDRVVVERRASPTVVGYRQTYAGFVRASSTLAWESSVAEPTSSTSVGTQRRRAG